MNQQNNPAPSATTSIKNSPRNKKKRKRKFFQVNNNAMNAKNSFKKNTLADTEEHDSSKLFQPKNKRRKIEKKNILEEGSLDIVKPVLVVKSPLDYSANWKNLKGIISPDDTSGSGNFVRRSKTKAKFDENINRKKPNEKHQKSNVIQSTNKKMQVEEDTIEEKEELDIWFDNVDPILLKENACIKPTKSDIMTNSKTPAETLVKEDSCEGPTKVIAMDCEMVGVGMDGRDSILARVSIVNQYGKVLCDKFVKPTEEVVDYRTAVSGIRPKDIKNGCEFSSVQKEVSDLLEGRVLVGHAVHNDLKILYLSHPRADIRDTAKYKPFVRKFGGRTPSLKKLVERFLGIQIQEGEHNSVQDAQAALRLYTTRRKEWEKTLNHSRKRRQKYIMKKNTNSGKNKEQPSEVS